MFLVTGRNTQPYVLELSEPELRFSISSLLGYLETESAFPTLYTASLIAHLMARNLAHFEICETPASWFGSRFESLVVMVEVDMVEGDKVSHLPNSLGLSIPAAD